MKVKGKHYRTVWMEDHTVNMIDQRLLPHRFSILELDSYQQTAEAIQDMAVRGAPAIGATAGYAVAQAGLEFEDSKSQKFWSQLEKAKSVIRSTRPTAVDLFHAVDRVSTEMRKAESTEKAVQKGISESQSIAEESVEACRKIGENGEKVIPEEASLLTHCNAGALATVDWGTALAPMRMAHYAGKKLFVFVDETRPRCQGARLTAWELLQERIPHSVIVDNAAGHYLRKGEIDLCIVGADRVASNGDFANKIGTYEKAVVAKENGVPFYVAVPFTTIDSQLGEGDEIPIEERSEEEVLGMKGWHQEEEVQVRITPKGSKAKNPAFDVTPARYVTGFITERGVFKPEELNNLLS